jgi:hypothetical protein
MSSEQLELDLWTQAEQWRPVVGYEGLYEVSDQGHVRSLERIITRNDPRRGLVRQRFPGRILTPQKYRGGYLKVALSAAASNEKVHRLVLEAFVGPCPPGMECCHYNDIPDDNRLSNLRWDTRSANRYDIHRNKPANKTHCRNGHKFTETNTRHKKNANGRIRHICLECRRERGREHRRRVGLRGRKTKLNADQAREIFLRCAAGESVCALAREYGVHRHRISDIKYGKVWRSVTDPLRDTRGAHYAA